MSNFFNYTQQDSVLDSIDMRETGDAKTFRANQRVRIPRVDEMIIDGKVVRVRVTDFADVVSMTEDKVVVSYRGEQMTYLFQELAELNRNSRKEFSTWSSFISRSAG